MKARRRSNSQKRAGQIAPHLREVRQLDEHSVTRYRAYPRHLLFWAHETLWSQSRRRRPTLPAHMITIGHDESSGELAPATIKKIIQTAQRLFHWARRTHHQCWLHIACARICEVS